MSAANELEVTMIDHGGSHPVQYVKELRFGVQVERAALRDEGVTPEEFKADAMLMMAAKMRSWLYEFESRARCLKMDSAAELAFASVEGKDCKHG